MHPVSAGAPERVARSLELPRRPVAAPDLERVLVLLERRGEVRHLAREVVREEVALVGIGDREAYLPRPLPLCGPDVRPVVVELESHRSSFLLRVRPAERTWKTKDPSRSRRVGGAAVGVTRPAPRLRNQYQGQQLSEP